MRFLCAFAAAALLAAAPSPDAVPAEVTSTLARLDADSAKLRPAMRIRVQVDAAQTLAERFPALAATYSSAAIAALKAESPLDVDTSLLFALVEVAPKETIALLPQMKPGSDAVVVSALLRANRLDLATDLFLSGLEKGPVHPAGVPGLLTALAKENPGAAAKTFDALMRKVDWDTLAPMDAYYLISCANAVQMVAPDAAAKALESVALFAAKPGFESDTQVTATFAFDKTTVTAANTRDALLIAAGARLTNLDRQRFNQHKDLFAKWDFKGAFSTRSLGMRPTAAEPVNPAAAEIAAIQKAMGTMRSLPTDADRAALVLDLVARMRALPDPARRVNMAINLSHTATEGDLGAKAMTALVNLMGESMRDAGQATLDQYTQLATLMRYERIPAPIDDPALTTAGDLLVLAESIHQGKGFSLISLDGKTYSLSALKGRVVLLNFWATWCPPCRKEMPDMEKLYSEFSKRGFVVLAVSDEERDTVAGYIAKQPYTFPVLLDPGREVHKAFGVEGIPKSFIFDRDGKIVAQAIDMRTERQFRELLKNAGLE